MPLLLIALVPTIKKDGIDCIDPELLSMYKTNIEKHNNLKKRDSGFDVLFGYDFQLAKECSTLISSGICSQMVDDDGTSDAGYLLLPRSSIYKTHMSQINSVGLIEADYRGPIKIPIVARHDLHHKKGETYFQLAHMSGKHFQVKLVDISQLSTTERDSKGFGSTGNYII